MDKLSVNRENVQMSKKELVEIICNMSTKKLYLLMLIMELVPKDLNMVLALAGYLDGEVRSKEVVVPKSGNR